MTRITLRLPDEVHRRLVASARGSALSLNQTIVAILSDALGCGKSSRAQGTPLDTERRRVREALGDVAVEFDTEDFARFVKRPLSEIDREALFRSMAGVNLSAGIIEERDENRY
jgi:hypothetical protein